MSKIFISYRRADAKSARLIYSELKRHFREDNVFFDPKIPEGSNFPKHLQDHARGCKVLLLLMGNDWIEEANKRKVAASGTDYVEREVEWARDGGAKVLPVLLEEASIPPEEELRQAGFGEVATIQASRIRFESENEYTFTVTKLIEAIERLLSLPPGPSPPGPPQPFPLVSIPGGTFSMGSDASEQGRKANEGFKHDITVQSFQLCAVPVTNDQYRSFLDSHPEYPRPRYWNDSRFNGPEQPVVGVSWDDASSFCGWAGLMLPTEAQWEFACRAGRAGAFGACSNVDALEGTGWYAKNSGWQLHPVCQKPANPYGLFDMLGNVAEWCRDTYLPDVASVEPDGAETKAAPRTFVVRGGAWDCNADECRCAVRQPRARVHRSPLIGFRPAKA